MYGVCFDISMFMIIVTWRNTLRELTQLSISYMTGCHDSVYFDRGYMECTSYMVGILLSAFG